MITSGNAGTIGPGFAGLSYEKKALLYKLFDQTNTNLIGLFNALGPSLLRIGGDSVDDETWTPTGADGTFGYITQNEVTWLAQFMHAVPGWQCLYGINVGGSSLTNPATKGYTDGTLAYQEVNYAKQQIGSAGFYGIELGNEPDSWGKTDSYYPNPNWSVTDFEPIWERFRAKVEQYATGGVVIQTAGPAGGHLKTYTDTPSLNHFTTAFTQDERTKVCLLTDHYYATHKSDYPNPNDPAELASIRTKLLTYPDTDLTSNLLCMKQARDTTYDGKPATGIRYRIGECNSSTAASDACSQFGAALWALEFMFACALGGADGVNFHGGLGSVYSPIMDDNTAVTAVGPLYYAMRFFNLAGQGTLYPTTISAQYSGANMNVSAFTVKPASGSPSVIVINKDPTVGISNLSLTFPAQVNTANLIILNAPDGLWASGNFKMQNAGIGLDGSWNTSQNYLYDLGISGAGHNVVSCNVPPACAVLIRTI